MFFTGEKFGKGRQINSVYSLTSPKMNLSEMKKPAYISKHGIKLEEGQVKIKDLYTIVLTEIHGLNSSLDEDTIEKGIDSNIGVNVWYLEGVDIPQKALVKDVQIRFVWQTSNDSYDDIAISTSTMLRFLTSANLLKIAKKYLLPLISQRDSETAKMPFGNLRSHG